MVSATLGQAAALSAGGELAQAMVVLEGAERALAEMTGETIVVELMKERAAGLRKSVVERVERGWTEIVCVRKEEGELRIRREITGRASLAFSCELLLLLVMLTDNWNT
jgi:centromere/kinetochore protein ZW10